MFEEIDDLQTKLVIPTDNVLSAINVNELFIKIELRAVLKIRLLFAHWAQNVIQNSLI